MPHLTRSEEPLTALAEEPAPRVFTDRGAGEARSASTPRGVRARWRRLIPPLIAAALGALLAACIPLRAGYDFFPHPDAAEYAWMARSMVEDHEIRIPVGGVWMPSRYPLGYPAFLALFIWLFRLGPYHLVTLSLLVGAFTVGLTFWFIRRIASSGAAWVGAFVMAASPPILIYSGRVMSDVPSAAWVTLLLAGWFFARRGAGMSRGKAGAVFLLLGILAGSGFFLRLANLVLILPHVGLAFWLLRRRGERLPGAAFLGGVALMGGLHLGLSWHLYGSPWATGYGFWFPGLFSPLGKVVNPRHLLSSPGNPQNYGSLIPYARALVGLEGVRNMMVPPPALLFLVPGLLTLRRRGGMAREIGRLAGLSLLCQAGLCGLYRWPVARLWIPAVPLLAIILGAGFHGMVSGSWGRGITAPLVRRVSAAVLVALVAGHGLWCVGALRASETGTHPPAHRGLRSMAPVVEPGALVMTDVLLPLVEFYLCPDRRAEVVPLVLRTRGKHIWHEDHARHLVRRGLPWSSRIRHFSQEGSGALTPAGGREIEEALKDGRQVLLLSGHVRGGPNYVRDFGRFRDALGRRFQVVKRTEADGLTLYQLKELTEG